MKFSVFWSRFAGMIVICLKVLMTVIMACWAVIFVIGAHHVITGTVPLRAGHVVGALIPPFIVALALLACLRRRAKS